ncbi:hypothetical protein TWF694_002197 [Orbilia ellipsospora]|uniref:C2H2-type domain-containing protein n=1 Tax=Orbilia ellipsospora TaxID=2528407 RepID=A0AAV9X2L5_9PEZI
MERQSQTRKGLLSNGSRSPKAYHLALGTHDSITKRTNGVEEAPQRIKNQRIEAKADPSLPSLPSISSLLFYANDEVEREHPICDNYLSTVHEPCFPRLHIGSTNREYMTSNTSNRIRRANSSEEITFTFSCVASAPEFYDDEEEESEIQEYKQAARELDIHLCSSMTNNPFNPRTIIPKDRTCVSEFPTASQPWSHHHHSAPSTSLSTTQPLDRYVCSQCTKTFSRPSSLRIHSHSHTGEKPFVCSHNGCGKAFSVRSNMKRHERGCHAT